MLTLSEHASLHSHACIEQHTCDALARDGWEEVITGAQPFASDSITHLHCTDSDSLAQQVRDWRLEIARLSAGEFTATGTVIPLDSLQVTQCALNQPLLIRMTPPAGCFAVILPQAGTGSLLLRGRELTEGRCAVVGVDADAEAVTRGSVTGCAIAVDEVVWGAMAEWAGDDPRDLEKGVHVRAPGTSWTESVLQAIQWISEALQRHPEGASSPNVRASLVDLMLLQLRAPVDSTAAQLDSRREHSRRRLAVERARSFIHDNLTSPIRLSQLCAHAHLQARSLEYGFLQMVGMSPISYIKVMRLNRARRMLLATHMSERTITEIAMDCGFWHLSQFAVDYRKFFGESPRTAHGAGVRPLVPVDVGQSAQESRQGR